MRVRTTRHTLGTSTTTKVEEHKVLGVPWNPDSDRLVLDVSELARQASTIEPTKRNLVSLIGRFYDPLGFLAPVVVKFKILFQKLCQDGIEWDSPLPEDLTAEWRALVSDLGRSLPISIPRFHLQGAGRPVLMTTLCGFSDSSSRAYAAVVYLVARTETNTSVQFITSKTRVAPLRPQTIPRLELLSAFLLSKLIVSVSESLRPIMHALDMKCYTDSQVTRYWIRGTGKEWRPFVQNHVNGFDVTFLQTSGTSVQGRRIQRTCHQEGSVSWS